MKNILKTISLRKMKHRESIREQSGFLIWYKDNTCKEVTDKTELLEAIQQETNKKQIRYIFDLADRIILDREVEIKNEGEIKNE